MNDKIVENVKVQKAEKQLCCPWPGLSANRMGVRHAVCLHALCVCCSLVMWLVSEIFPACYRNYPLLVENACLSVCLHMYIGLRVK